MRVEEAFVGARIVDSLPFAQAGTAAQARRMKASGVDGFIGYLGAMNPTRLGYILDAGLGFMPVTFAQEYRDGAADEIAQLTALGLPKGVTTWCDLEGMDVHNRGKVLAERAKDLALMSAWARDIGGAGFMPGLYLGAPQPFTSEEVFMLPFVRYWWGVGMPVDDKRKLVYPGKNDLSVVRGWCMKQQWHGNPEPGRKGGMLWPPVAMDPTCPESERVFVDTNGVEMDHKGGRPVWARA